nr:type II toxin-antitoxin system RelE/ParE family toxin [Thermoactinomyces sp. DSM 45892]
MWLLQPLKKLYLEAIQAISANPYMGGLKIGDLSGIYGYDIKYKGINYELAYRVFEDDEGNMILVIMCGMDGRYVKGRTDFTNGN